MNMHSGMNPAQPVRFSVQKAAEILKQANRQFDGRRHGEMNRAKTDEDWQKIADMLLNAHQNHNLRRNVSNRFFKDCPNKDMVSGLQRLTGNLPTPQPIRKTRAQIEANRSANRAKRAEEQPAKGKGGKQPDKHGKGDKKSKK